MRLPPLEEALGVATTALLIGNGGGSDCFATVLLTPYLKTLGIRRVFAGGVACQWWPEQDGQPLYLQEVLGPDFYDPCELPGVLAVGRNAVRISPTAGPGPREPHEAVLARLVRDETFILTLRNGVEGVAEGIAVLAESCQADLIISVDVGSDSLSTGRELRPTQTALADHMTLAALTQQNVHTYFCLAAYGADSEMEPEELEESFGRIIQSGGLRGAVIPTAEAIALYERLNELAPDPVGPLVVRAVRGDFGAHLVKKNSPWGEVARLGPTSAALWVMDPAVVVGEVAVDALHLVGTTSLAVAEARYVSLGRIPETTIARTVQYGRVGKA